MTVAPSQLHCNALRNGNPVMPRGRHPEGEHTLSNAERQARYRERRQADQPTPVVRYRRPVDRPPAYSAGTTRSRGCSPCKPNMPTPCRTVSATPPPLWPYRPSSNLISMNSLPSCRRADTVAINMLDDHPRKMRSDNCRWQQPTMML